MSGQVLIRIQDSDFLTSQALLLSVSHEGLDFLLKISVFHTVGCNLLMVYKVL